MPPPPPSSPPRHHHPLPLTTTTTATTLSLSIQVPLKHLNLYSYLPRCPSLTTLTDSPPPGSPLPSSLTFFSLPLSLTRSLSPTPSLHGLALHPFLFILGRTWSTRLYVLSLRTLTPRVPRDANFRIVFARESRRILCVRKKRVYEGFSRVMCNVDIYCIAVLHGGSVMMEVLWPAAVMGERERREGRREERASPA